MLLQLPIKSKLLNNSSNAKMINMEMVESIAASPSENDSFNVFAFFSNAPTPVGLAKDLDQKEMMSLLQYVKDQSNFIILPGLGLVNPNKILMIDIQEIQKDDPNTKFKISYFNPIILTTSGGVYNCLDPEGKIILFQTREDALNYNKQVFMPILGIDLIDSEKEEDSSPSLIIKAK